MPKAAVCVGLNEPLEIQDLELEAPRAGEIRVRMGASGVCHSDLSIQNGTLMGAFPMVLGHEGAGVVEELGDGVEGLAVGDHVVVSWVPQCGESRSRSWISSGSLSPTHTAAFGMAHPPVRPFGYLTATLAPRSPTDQVRDPPARRP